VGLRWVFNGFDGDVVNGFKVIFLVVLCMILWVVFLIGLQARFKVVFEWVYGELIGGVVGDFMKMLYHVLLVTLVRILVSYYRERPFFNAKSMMND